MSHLVDTLECQSCGAPMIDLYWPVTVMQIGIILCHKCGALVSGTHFWHPSNITITWTTIVVRDQFNDNPP